MANITITPTGAAFNPTDTVTSTRLNEARNPTAALVAASVVPSDLSLGAPTWDTLGNTTTGSIFTGGEAIEINSNNTGNRNAYVDLHTAGTNIDFNARIFRGAGEDSDLQILNQGTGTIVINSSIAQINSNNQSVTTKDYVNSAIQAALQAAQVSVYPVGSIYINATDATDPATLLGFGTWAIFGAGQVPVGIDSSQVEFDTAGKTGGSKDAVVVEHTHTTPPDILFGNQATGGNNIDGPGSIYAKINTDTRQTASTGVSGTNKNLQPYVVVYMWTRTA